MIRSVALAFTILFLSATSAFSACLPVQNNIIKSDVTGEPPHYFNGENCRWTINCPQGAFSIVSLTGNLRAEDPLTVESIARTKVFTGALSTPSYTLFSAPTNVTFKTSGSGVSTGFVLTYDCQQSSCVAAPKQSSGAFAVSYTVPKATLEHCDFTLTPQDCHTGMGTIVSVDIEDSKDLSEDSILIDGTTYPNKNSAPELFLQHTHNVRVLYYEPQDTHIDLNMSYECAYHSNNCTATAIPMRGPIGWIYSDTDGAGPTPYKNGEKCNWVIECELGAVKIRLLKGVLYGRDKVTLSSTTKSTDFTYTFNDEDLVYDTPLSVSFTSDGSAVREGFTLSYKCIEAVCSLADSPTILPHLTQWSASGYYTSDSTLNENCTWIVQRPSCIPGMGVVASVKVASSMVPSSFYVGSTPYPNPSSGPEVFFDDPVDFLITYAEPPSTPVSFNVSYECAYHSNNCTATAVPMRGPIGWIYSDTDGIGPDKHKNGRDKVTLSSTTKSTDFTYTFNDEDLVYDTPLSVSFTSDGSAVREGFTLSYECPSGLVPVAGIGFKVTVAVQCGETLSSVVAAIRNTSGLILQSVELSGVCKAGMVNISAAFETRDIAEKLASRVANISGVDDVSVTVVAEMSWTSVAPFSTSAPSQVLKITASCNFTANDVIAGLSSLLHLNTTDELRLVNDDENTRCSNGSSTYDLELESFERNIDEVLSSVSNASLRSIGIEEVRASAAESEVPRAAPREEGLSGGAIVGIVSGLLLLLLLLFLLLLLARRRRLGRKRGGETSHWDSSKYTEQFSTVAHMDESLITTERKFDQEDPEMAEMMEVLQKQRQEVSLREDMVEML